MPVEAPVVVTLASLPDLAAHEEELLARVRPHVRVEGAKVGKLLPVVAGHLGEERTLAVHDLVVRERQHEVLRPGVQEAERQLVVAAFSVDPVPGPIVEGVGPPPPGPLEPPTAPPR